MTSQPPHSSRVNVIPISAHRPPQGAPHIDRIHAIRKWHNDQIDAQCIASLNISITTTGALRIEGVCIEPEHAAVMLGAMPSIKRRLMHITNERTSEAASSQWSAI